MNTVGKRLRVLRAAQGDPPQTRVAEAIGKSVRSYNGWEADRTRPGYRSAVALAEFYGTTPDWILYGSHASADERFASIESKLDDILKLLNKRR